MVILSTDTQSWQEGMEQFLHSYLRGTPLYLKSAVFALRTMSSIGFWIHCVIIVSVPDCSGFLVVLYMDLILKIRLKEV